MKKDIYFEEKNGIKKYMKKYVKKRILNNI